MAGEDIAVDDGAEPHGLLVAVAFALTGLAIVAGTLATLRLGTWGNPGPGAFPLLLGLVILLLAAGSGAARLRRLTERGSAGEGPVLTGRELRVAVLFFALFFAYVAVFQPLGFLLSSIVFLALMMRAFSGEPWLRSVVVAAAVAVVAFAGFVHLLNLNLPRGPLGYGLLG